jgi:hypothetical protein
MKEKNVALIQDEKPRKRGNRLSSKNSSAVTMERSTQRTKKPIAKFYPFQMVEPASAPGGVPSGPAPAS